MIVDTEKDIIELINSINNINEIILNKKNTNIMPEVLESIVSNSIYYRDFKLQISGLVSGLCRSQVFIDGNKRTAFILLISLSSIFRINLKQYTNKEWADIIINCGIFNWTAEEFNEKVFL